MTLPETGSMRTTFDGPFGPPSMPIQTSVPSLATQPSSGTRRPTLLVAASTRTTDSLFWMSTQTPPGPAVMICGPADPVGPTGIVATTLLVAGSMRVTAPSCSSATHTEPAVTATPSGADPDERDRRNHLASDRVDPQEDVMLVVRLPDGTGAGRVVAATHRVQGDCPVMADVARSTRTRLVGSWTQSDWPSAANQRGSTGSPTWIRLVGPKGAGGSHRWAGDQDQGRRRGDDEQGGEATVPTGLVGSNWCGRPRPWGATFRGSSMRAAAACGRSAGACRRSSRAPAPARARP